jgi:hypothetical protein
MAADIAISGSKAVVAAALASQGDRGWSDAPRSERESTCPQIVTVLGADAAASRHVTEKVTVMIRGNLPPMPGGARRFCAMRRKTGVR